jgi:hypothetical protein
MADRLHCLLEVFMDGYDTRFDCTPAQYHGAIDRIWKALDVQGPQQEDCFTMAAKEIVRLRKRVKELEDHLALRKEVAEES